MDLTLKLQSCIKLCLSKHIVTVCSTDLYLVNAGIVVTDLFITVNNLSMELTAALDNNINMSQVAICS